jgi:putative DNA primase/helicase
MNDGVGHSLAARAELEHRHNFGLGIAGGPHPDLLSGLFDLRPQFIELDMRQLQPGEKLVMEFASVVAAAGELASEAGITGWDAGTATAGVCRCFADWLAARGHLDNGEDAQALAQVKAFIEKNGDALFTWLHRAHDDHRPNTAMRAGFKRQVDEQGKPVKMDGATEYLEKRSSVESSDKFNAATEYLVLPEAWKRDVCKGLDARMVAELMRKRGHLVFDKGGLQRTHRVPGVGQGKFYHLKPTVLADEL